MTDTHVPPDIALTCPSCAGALDTRRILESSGREGYVAQVSDYTVWFWTFRLSCPGCLSVVTIDDRLDGRVIELATKGTVVARLRDRLVAARAGGTIAQCTTALEPAEWKLLGTPELFAEVADSLGRRLHLVAAGAPREFEICAQPAPPGFTAPPWFLEPLPAPAKKSKVKAKKKPAAAPESELLPAGTAVELIGIREGRLRCSCPAAGRELLVPVAMAGRAG